MRQFNAKTFVNFLKKGLPINLSKKLKFAKGPEDAINFIQKHHNLTFLILSAGKLGKLVDIHFKASNNNH